MTSFQDSNDDTVLACPECDSTTIESNVGHDMQGIRARSKHRCNDCGHCFDEHDAVYRERKNEVLPRGDSLARTLHDADPDTPLTDGGSVQGEADETGARCVDDTERCSRCGDPADLRYGDEWLCPEHYEGEPMVGGHVGTRQQTAEESRKRLARKTTETAQGGGRDE